MPEGHYTVPLGKAAVVREGGDLTVLAYGTMVHVALAAVEEQGLDAEVIDLRTLVPLDIETIEQSVKKTGRCLVVHEAPRTCGFGAELVALVQERCFYHLEAPVERVTGWDTPYPHSLRMGLFPRPEAHEESARESDGRLMARYEFKLPDIGEGIAEAEIVAWHVKVGDTIGEDQQIADMMTDKATVEMESPVAGKVIELAGEVGDQVPIGSVLAVIETEGADRAAEPVDDSKDERPLADGAVEATPEQAEEIPVTSSAPACGRGRGAQRRRRGPVEPRAVDRPSPSPSRKREGSARPRLARRPRPRPRPRHRPWPGEDGERPHPPLRPRRLSALQRRQRFGAAARRAAQGRDDQGRRPAPQDRREHAGGEAPHPALHPGRGIRRHRARRHARDDERATAARTPS